MLEALWSVKFRSSFGLEGNGIVVLETGKILGGDSSMIYLGEYESKNGELRVTLEVRKYADAPGLSSIVGLNEFHLELSGVSNAKQIELSGYVIEDPARKVNIAADWRAELP